MALRGRVLGIQGYCRGCIFSSCKQPENENKSTGLNVHPYRIRLSLRCSVFLCPLSLHTWGISILQLSQPALRYWNRCKYRIADTACFSFFGTVLCGIVFALVLHFFAFFLHFFLQNIAKYCKISQNTAKYCRYHRYRDRKRVVHQVKYATFSRRYRRCRMFF